MSRSSQRAKMREVEKTRRQWLGTVNRLDAIVAGEPEPGSVLNQLARIGVLPELDTILRVTTLQGTQFIRAAQNVPLTADGPELSPVGPLARSALLSLSKVVAIAAPLCLETRGIGPAIQHHHDGLIDLFLEQDRNAEFDPESATSKVWIDKGRAPTLERFNNLRKSLGLKTVPVPKGPSPSHALVTDGSWVWEANRITDTWRAFEGKPSEEESYRMRWAWHRGSVVTHGSFSAVATPNGLSYTYLSPVEATALVRYSVELAAVAQRFLSGIWNANAAPKSFDFNATHRVPRHVADHPTTGLPESKVTS